MRRKPRIAVILIVTTALSLLWADAAGPSPNPYNLQAPVTYSAMQSFLETVGQVDFITVSEEGRTTEGRRLYLVHLNRGERPGQWKVFLFAQQHGNEPAGKDALLRLIGEIAGNPAVLPRNVDLWIVPMVNPDGAEANRRYNGAGADLNRDHQSLNQPEVQTLHRLYRKIMPDVAVDSHEFTRDSEDYRERGWTEWPQIMMDCANNPVLGNDLYAAGVAWCEEAGAALDRLGINFMRYHVGGPPPEGELRFSTTEADDARNGLGAYGGLSFIIESGVKRSIGDLNSDLPQRIEAYLALYKFLLNNSGSQRRDRPVIDAARLAPMPPFIPTNYFFGNVGVKVHDVPVYSLATGNVEYIPTANFVQDLIVKKSVTAPMGYLIHKDQADVFAAFLRRHDIVFQVLNQSREYLVEGARLVRLETDWDDLYSRYENRQIVKSTGKTRQQFPAGSLVVRLDRPGAQRAALHLEPSMLYGLYQYPEFKPLIGPDKQLPVWRILE